MDGNTCKNCGKPTEKFGLCWNCYKVTTFEDFKYDGQPTEKILYIEWPKCPYCGSEQVSDEQSIRTWDALPAYEDIYRCEMCGKHFCVKIGYFPMAVRPLTEEEEEYLAPHIAMQPNTYVLHKKSGKHGKIARIIGDEKWEILWDDWTMSAENETDLEPLPRKVRSEEHRIQRRLSWELGRLKGMFKIGHGLKVKWIPRGKNIPGETLGNTIYVYDEKLKEAVKTLRLEFARAFEHRV